MYGFSVHFQKESITVGKRFSNTPLRIVSMKTFNTSASQYAFHFTQISDAIKPINVALSFRSVFLLHCFFYNEESNISKLSIMICSCAFDFKTYLELSSQCISEYARILHQSKPCSSSILSKDQ